MVQGLSGEAVMVPPSRSVCDLDTRSPGPPLAYPEWGPVGSVWEPQA